MVEARSCKDGAGSPTGWGPGRAWLLRHFCRAAAGRGPGRPGWAAGSRCPGPAAAVKADVALLTTPCGGTRACGSARWAGPAQQVGHPREECFLWGSRGHGSSPPPPPAGPTPPAGCRVAAGRPRSSSPQPPSVCSVMLASEALMRMRGWSALRACHPRPAGETRMSSSRSRGSTLGPAGWALSKRLPEASWHVELETGKVGGEESPG